MAAAGAPLPDAAECAAVEADTLAVSSKAKNQKVSWKHESYRFDAVSHAFSGVAALAKNCIEWWNQHEQGKEARNILKLAGPFVMVNLAYVGLAVTDMMFVGQLGTRELAAAQLAWSFAWATGYIALGLVYGMDTLVSQAFGAGNMRLVCTILQNSFVVLTAAFIPVAILWWNGEGLLILLGQEPATCALAGSFLRYFLPGFLPFLYYRALLRFFLNQALVAPIAVIGVVVLNYVFIFSLGLGFIGSPIATSISRFCMPILLWSFVRYRYKRRATGRGATADTMSSKSPPPHDTETSSVEMSLLPAQAPSCETVQVREEACAGEALSQSPTSSPRTLSQSLTSSRTLSLDRERVSTLHTDSLRESLLVAASDCSASLFSASSAAASSSSSSFVTPPRSLRSSRTHSDYQMLDSRHQNTEPLTRHQECEVHTRHSHSHDLLTVEEEELSAVPLEDSEDESDLPFLDMRSHASSSSSSSSSSATSPSRSPRRSRSSISRSASASSSSSANEEPDFVWYGWCAEALCPRRLSTFMRYGLPAGLMMLFEVCGNQIPTIFSGLLPQPDLQLAATSIAYNITEISFVFPLAICIGAGTRVGHLLGAGDARGARLAARMGIWLAVAQMNLNAIIIVCARKILPTLYTSEADAVGRAGTLLLFAALFAFLDGLQTVCGGILRGAGQPARTCFITFAGLYCVGLPLAYCFGFTARLQAEGVWLGVCVGMLCIFLGFLFSIMRLDWEIESVRARERSERISVQKDETHA